jgi:hypothetical protein
MSIEEDGLNVRGSRCDLCDGVGIVTVAAMRNWKVANAIARQREGPK